MNLNAKTQSPLLSILLGMHLLSAAAFAQDCVISGCNSEICTDMPLQHYGICKWEPEYACYHQYGVCERDAASGQCAWVQSPELIACFTKVAQEIAGESE